MLYLFYAIAFYALLFVIRYLVIFLQLVYLSQFLGSGEDFVADVAMTTQRRLSPITLGCQTG